jgi:hypothetical protein
MKAFQIGSYYADRNGACSNSTVYRWKPLVWWKITPCKVLQPCSSSSLRH